MIRSSKALRRTHTETLWQLLRRYRVPTILFINKMDLPGRDRDTLLRELRARLSEYYHINQQNVHAYVMGEHGDSSFVPWSVANISNVPIEECSMSLKTAGVVKQPALDFSDIEHSVRTSGARVIERKGAT